MVERLGDPFAPRSFSLIAIHRHGIPNVFSEELLQEAERVAGQPLGDGREDLRDLPIVAIDPADARDHDDAVWATPDDDPKNVQKIIEEFIALKKDYPKVAFFIIETAKGQVNKWEIFPGHAEKQTLNPAEQLRLL